MKSSSYIISIVLVLLISFFLSSCDKSLLNTHNPNQPTTKTYWKTKKQAIKGVNAVYGALRVDGSYKRFTNTVADLRAEDTEADSPWNVMTASGDFKLTATMLPVRLIWKAYYEGIFRANQVFEHVPNISMDNTLKQRLLGETHFLRGFFYFNLLKFYHNVPLVLHTAKGPQDYDVPQSPPDSVWAQIEKDFKKAIPALPMRYDKANKGRATKGAAEAYLGKAYLFTKKWKEAAKEFKKVIDSGRYGLIKNYRANFTSKDENNKESIFEVQFSKTAGGSANCWQVPFGSGCGITQARSITYAPTGFGWADIQPTHTLLNVFKNEKTVNGKPDPRLRATLFYNYPGETVYGVPFKQEYSGKDSTDVFWRKYESDTPGGNEFDAKSGINIRTMRYADVLLMYAEAENNLGHTATAYKYVQKVRDRANLPDLRTVKPALSQKQMQAQIAHQRFLELAGEGHRFDDIVRWGWLKNPKKLKWLQKRDPEFNGYVPGHEYLPIPQSELDVNPKLKQNPGY
ncbi:MAG TPA: RagB/SusD family nutrient uptake outer membrane protein [Balneolaceae bacterium]|nr:RagB/SusD family nutrient uptake outer membrane protein [Balneolaceae bacterium]